MSAESSTVAPNSSEKATNILRCWLVDRQKACIRSHEPPYTTHPCKAIGRTWRTLCFGGLTFAYARVQEKGIDETQNEEVNVRDGEALTVVPLEVHPAAHKGAFCVRSRATRHSNSSPGVRVEGAT